MLQNHTTVNTFHTRKCVENCFHFNDLTCKHIFLMILRFNLLHFIFIIFVTDQFTYKLYTKRKIEFKEKKNTKIMFVNFIRQTEAYPSILNVVIKLINE